RVEVQGTENEVRTYRIETADGEDIRRDLARSIVQGGHGLLELKQVGMSLEDIYLQLTTSEEPEESLVSAEPEEVEENPAAADAAEGGQD
ncbi:MAG: hypothetical protein ACE5JI_03735, partial [Acidobacteriota bacterium]